MGAYLVLLEMVNMEREVSKKPNTESTCQSLDRLKTYTTCLSAESVSKSVLIFCVCFTFFVHLFQPWWPATTPIIISHLYQAVQRKGLDGPTTGKYVHEKNRSFPQDGPKKTVKLRRVVITSTDRGEKTSVIHLFSAIYRGPITPFRARPILQH